MNWFDSAISKISPAWGFRRLQFRSAISTYAAYEAAKPGRLRKTPGDNSSGDTLTLRAGQSLRGYARNLDQNHDIARGVLNVLVNNVVGSKGISIEPQPMTKDGQIHEKFANDLMLLWNDWVLKPEVTHEHDWCSSERLMCRSWLRDGESLAQFLEGNIPSLEHGTVVPFSIELIEADLLPMTLSDISKNITQGVERNAWGRPVAYHIYKQHPGDSSSYFNIQTKRVSSDRMIHIKLTDRIKQARGVTIFASVMRRLEDLKDYEESERIAARVAAAMTGFVKKGNADLYVPPDDPNEQRSFKMQPGMVFDNLQMGEDVGTVQSNRPSSLLDGFRNAMMKAVSSGTSANYSSVARDYDGSYSSQRQELVEGWSNYQSLTGLFISQFTRPIWKRFVEICVMSGQVRVPEDLDRRTMFDADYRGPAMPWIDPEKEAKSKERLERAGYKSAQQIIREMGGNPNQTRKQIKVWRDQADSEDLIFTTDAKHNLVSSTTDNSSASSDSEN